MKPGWFADQSEQPIQPATKLPVVDDEEREPTPPLPSAEPVVELPPHPWKLRERPNRPA